MLRFMAFWMPEGNQEFSLSNEFSFDQNVASQTCSFSGIFFVKHGVPY